MTEKEIITKIKATVKERDKELGKIKDSHEWCKCFLEYSRIISNLELKIQRLKQGKKTRSIIKSTKYKQISKTSIF